MADRDELVEATVQVRNIRQGVTEKASHFDRYHTCYAHYY